MFSNLVGWVNYCVRLNSFKRSMNSAYWCLYLQSGEMVGILSAQRNMEKLESPITHVWPLTVDTFAIGLLTLQNSLCPIHWAYNSQQCGHTLQVKT